MNLTIVSTKSIVKRIVKVHLWYKFVGLQPTVIASRAPHLLVDVRRPTCVARQGISSSIVKASSACQTSKTLPDAVWPAAARQVVG